MLGFSLVLDPTLVFQVLNMRQSLALHKRATWSLLTYPVDSVPHKTQLFPFRVTHFQSMATVARYVDVTLSEFTSSCVKEFYTNLLCLKRTVFDSVEKYANRDTYAPDFRLANGCEIFLVQKQNAFKTVRNVRYKSQIIKFALGLNRSHVWSDLYSSAFDSKSIFHSEFDPTPQDAQVL